ncbi:MAG: succinate dehydrogenase, hydrophobic membrane anchor protein [Pseudomonadota bacterium]
MSLRSPLAAVRGLGSAKEGVHHWWAQRLTALALVPLALWFVISLIGVAGEGHDAVLNWVGSPIVAVLLIALIVAVFHHAQLGMQVIYEDYIHSTWLKMAADLGTKALCFLLGVTGILAVVRIALGS